MIKMTMNRNAGMARANPSGRGLARARGRVAAWLALFLLASVHGHGQPLKPAATTQPAAGSGLVVFSVMGNGPANLEEETAFKRYLSLENLEGVSEFLFHLGGVGGASGDAAAEGSEAADSVLSRVAAEFRGRNRIPAFALPGAPEWLGKSDPDTAWVEWSEHLLRLNEAFSKSPPVERQSGRPENFRFVHNGVVFVGINRMADPVRDRATAETRVRDAADWVSDSLARHPDIRGAVLLANANAAGRMQSRFLPVLRQSARRFGKPVLYVHSGGDRWFVKAGEWERNITRIQLARLNADGPPVEIILFETEQAPIQWNRRINDGRFYLPRPD